MRGPVREPGLIMAGTSRIEMDIAGVKLIKEYPGNSLEKIKPEELIQIKLAQELKIDDYGK